MATIKPYTLKSGKVRYDVQIYDHWNKGTGKQANVHKAGFDTWEEANDWAKEKTADLVKQKRTGRWRDKMLIKDWLAEWVTKYKVNVKEGSMIIYRYNIDHYLIPNIGNYMLREYTPTVHQQFILDMLDHGGKDGAPLQRNTVSIINATIGNALAKAMKLHYIPENPTISVEYPRSAHQVQRLHYWSVPQGDAFLEAVKADRNKVWYYFFLTILDLGLRKGEALALTWDDINFVDNTVDINKTRLYRAEVHEHSGEVILDDPKYPASFRTLYMTKRLRAALLEYRALWYPNGDVIAIEDGAPQIPAGEFVWKHMGTKRYFGQVVGESGVYGAMKRATDQIKPALPTITVHDLRHTLGVTLRESGVPLEDIKDILGHKDISTTQIYAEITPKVKRSATHKLNEYLEKQQKSAPKKGRRVTHLNSFLNS